MSCDAYLRALRGYFIRRWLIFNENQLEWYTAAWGAWWGLWMLLFRPWEVFGKAFATLTYAPATIGAVFLCLGVAQLAAVQYGSVRTRRFLAGVGFVTWLALTAHFVGVYVGLAAVPCYAMAAIGEISIYVSLTYGMALYDRQSREVR